MTIAHIITPKDRDIGDFSVRRVLPSRQQRMVGPWIFFDHMGPAVFPAGKGINVRPHPHINLATVTYLFEGEVLHRDSLGNEETIHPGDINLMVAGKGIVHSERERPEVRDSSHTLHGLQLWHALPEADEECAPSFHHYDANALPSFVENGVPVRVMMGTAYGQTSPVRTFAETVYVEAFLKVGDTLDLPQAEQLAVYVASGQISLGGKTVDRYSMAILDDNTSDTVSALSDAQIAVIGGEKMSKRYMDWNFASSRQERIEQAKEDWKHGRFPIIPTDCEEFIPLPEKRGL